MVCYCDAVDWSSVADCCDVDADVGVACCDVVNWSGIAALVMLLVEVANLLL
jgi:hypothetical protein